MRLLPSGPAEIWYWAVGTSAGCQPHYPWCAVSLRHPCVLLNRLRRAKDYEVVTQLCQLFLVPRRTNVMYPLHRHTNLAFSVVFLPLFLWHGVEEHFEEFYKN